MQRRDAEKSGESLRDYMLQVALYLYLHLKLPVYRSVSVAVKKDVLFQRDSTVQQQGEREHILMGVHPENLLPITGTACSGISVSAYRNVFVPLCSDLAAEQR